MAIVRRSPVSFAVFVALGVADDVAFERFDGVLQVFDIASCCSKTDCHTNRREISETASGGRD